MKMSSKLEKNIVKFSAFEQIKESLFPIVTILYMIVTPILEGKKCKILEFEVQFLKKVENPALFFTAKKSAGLLNSVKNRA